MAPAGGAAKNGSVGGIGPKSPTGPAEEERKFPEKNYELSKREKQKQERDGASGASGAINDIDRLIDSDLIGSKNGPTNGPTDQKNGAISIKAQREAGEQEAQIEWLDDETDIVWLKEPHQYTYLREAIASSSRPDGPIDLNPDDDKTLIGYTTVSPNDEEYYERRLWYLTKQDQDPAGIYSSGPAPSGAVDPKSISAGASSIPWECPTVEPTPEGEEEIRFLARFRTPYKTEWPRGGGRYKSVTYQVGEECIVPLERALQWKGRGVVDLMEIVLPWEPPEEATA